jgi:hypothetical protein
MSILHYLAILVFPNWSVCWIVHFKVAWTYVFMTYNDFMGGHSVQTCFTISHITSPPIVLACIDHYPKPWNWMKKSQNILVWLRKLVVAQHKYAVSGGCYEVQERSASGQREYWLTAARCFWLGGLLLVVPHVYTVPCFSFEECGFRKKVDN